MKGLAGRRTCPSSRRRGKAFRRSREQRDAAGSTKSAACGDVGVEGERAYDGANAINMVNSASSFGLVQAHYLRDKGGEGGSSFMALNELDKGSSKTKR